MAFHKFSEYLDDKKKLVEKPKTEKVPDYSGPKPTKPAKPQEKGDGWEAMVKSKGEAAPYKAPGTDPGQKKAEKGGFADMGDKDLKYEPKNDVEKAGEGGKKVSSWPKTKTESFLDDTKEMSLPTFAKHVRGQMNEHCGCENKKAPHVVAYSAGAFHPDPIQAIKYVVYLTNENENILRALMQEARRSGCLDKYISEMFTYPESYQEMASIMNDPEEGPKVSRSLVRAMNDQYHAYIEQAKKIKESVAPPAHYGSLDDEEQPQRTPPPIGSLPGEGGKPDNIVGEEHPPGDNHLDQPPHMSHQRLGHDGTGKKFPWDAPMGHQHLASALQNHDGLR